MQNSTKDDIYAESYPHQSPTAAKKNNKKDESFIVHMTQAMSAANERAFTMISNIFANMPELVDRMKVIPLECKV